MDIEVTLPTFHAEISPLKLLARLKVESRLVTLATFQLERSPLKLLAP